jgi:type IV secretory pathway VirD2 relaxase
MLSRPCAHSVSATTSSSASIVHGWERATSSFVLASEAQPSPVIGRLVARGLDDELTGTAYAVIDGIDSRAHHIRLSDLEAAGDSGPGSIVELRRYEDSKKKRTHPVR